MPPEARLDRLLSECRKEGIDGLIIVPGPNMRYLIDFTLEVFERPAFLVAGFGDKPALLVPHLDYERAQEAVSKLCEVASYTDETGPWKWMEERLSELVGVAGIEGRIPLGLFKNLEKRAGRLSFVVVDNFLHSLRISKDTEEVSRHREAARILQEAMLRTLTELQPGLKERELMFRFHRHADELGAETSYCLIQSGPNSSKPHLEPTSRTVKSEDVVVFDAALTYRGYYADITRTVCIGRPSVSLLKIYNVVKEAQQKALDRAMPGVPAEDVDKAARKRIADEGLAEYFIHRTGHGLGVEVHEEPYIKNGNRKPLKNGMIFTVEPGIYLPAKFGVRLEDNVVVTTSGIENTTYIPKTLSLRETLDAQ
ncbi:MAG: Xaa-Pro peptidase family protein [Candidatus Caldarchaeum sp.]|jgi:Xaa-Pro aminopeptidase